METTTRHPACWFAGLLLICVMCGCESGDPIEVLFGDAEADRPVAVAAQAANPYYADKRREAIARLGAAPWGGDPAYLKLYRTAITDEDPTVVAACLKALGRHGEPSDVPLLIEHLDEARHPQPFVRIEAAKALQKIHNPVAVEPLINAMTRDENADVRQAAAGALGQYREPIVFNALVSALDDPDYGVVFAARESLVTLTGQQQLGTRSREWLSWRDKQEAALFAEAQPYRWQPYNKPWRWYNYLFPPFLPPDDKPPQPPAGLEVTRSEASPDNSGTP